MNRGRESERDAHTQTHQPIGHIRTYRLPHFQSTGRWLKQVEVAPRGDAAEEKPSGVVQRTPLAADKVKDPLTMEKQAKVVYCIPCSCGEAYIGETVRRLETRVKEHRDACQKGALEKSALAEHAWMNHHAIQWEEVSVIDRARTAKELLVKDAIHIRLNHPSLNRELPRCRMAALKNTGSVCNQKTCGAN